MNECCSWLVTNFKKKGLIGHKQTFRKEKTELHVGSPFDIVIMLNMLEPLIWQLSLFWDKKKR